MASDKAKAPENAGPSEEQPMADAEADVGDESGSESEAEVPAAASAESGPSRPSKKKKKLAKVKEEHGEDSPAADEDAVRQLLKQLKLRDVAEGKAGLGGKHKKDAGDHKVRHPLHRICAKPFLSSMASVLGDAARPSLWCVVCIPSIWILSPPILGQAIVPPKKTGTSNHLSPEKRSGKTRIHCQRTSSGVFST